jgi:hypothetical protein
LQIFLNKGGIMHSKIKNAVLKIKSGTAMTESILLIGISLAIIIIVFYPQLKELVNDTLNTISIWFKSTLGNIGM